MVVMGMGDEPKVHPAAVVSNQLVQVSRVGAFLPAAVDDDGFTLGSLQQIPHHLVRIPVGILQHAAAAQIHIQQMTLHDRSPFGIWVYFNTEIVELSTGNGGVALSLSAEWCIFAGMELNFCAIMLDIPLACH